LPPQNERERNPKVFYHSDKLPTVTRKTTVSTTAVLVQSLDAIIHQIATMEDALRDAPAIADVDRRRLRWETHELRHRAEFLMNWFAEERIEDKH
jgi:hypothetical protein